MGKYERETQWMGTEKYCRCVLRIRAVRHSRGIYKSVTTENSVLKIEVWLQLFSLYIVESRQSQATDVIKEAVDFQPDYPNVTKMARAFFEEQKDWSNAIELAVNESIRTKSLVWFDVLKKYIEQGVAQTIATNYFVGNVGITIST